MNSKYMSKKDYILIAKVLASEKPSIMDNNYPWARIVRAMAQTLKLQNSRFDSEKFLIACGLYTL